MITDPMATPSPEPQHASQRCLLGTEHTGFSIPEEEIVLGDRNGAGFAVIGQDRAILAIEMALNIRAKGYNLFVSGPAGTGKRTAVKSMLDKLEPELDRLKDICLVYNFEEPDSPKPLYMPAGTAQNFRRALRAFLLELSQTIGDLSHHPQFRRMRDQLILRAESEEQQLIFDFEGRVNKEGFKIVQLEGDEEGKTDILPFINNEISDFGTLQNLVAKGEMSELDYTNLRERQMQFTDEMQGLFQGLQKRRADIQKNLEKIRQQVLEPSVNEGLRRLAADFPYEGIGEFLNDVQNHLSSYSSFIYQLSEEGSLQTEGRNQDNSLEDDGYEMAQDGPPNLTNKVGKSLTKTSGLALMSQGVNEKTSATKKNLGPTHSGETKANQTKNQGGRNIPAWLKAELPEYLRIYDVNIMVDNGSLSSNPVIFEQYPDYSKLFGVIDPPPENAGENSYPHLLVKAGSLLKASGGYLILRAEDLLRDEELYVAVKRVLQDEALEIRNLGGNYGQGSGTSIKSQPIDIDVKLIVMGADGIYEALFERDEEFEKLFKVPAEFDSTVDRSPAITQTYADFFAMIAREDKLPPLSKGAVAALLEYAVRVAEFRNKLSTRFSLLADILRESAYWTKKTKGDSIERKDVAQALKAREFIYNLPEEKIDEQILLGEILLHVDGRAVGRINGLAVMDRGFYAFGRPMVISSQAAPGTNGVVNVEREAGLSGEIHDKGAFIVESYIQAHYAKDFPLSINASICFEQSYSEVDGDSASSTEIYALLSAISGIALRQDIAVTGSVNQMGQIQPVGGVVEKIEGFFWVCKKVGLTGKQGVIIPFQNLQNLILNHEVQEALKDKKFHLWAIRTIDEGMEILSGMSAGIRNSKGVFPPNTVNVLVEKRLREMAKVNKEFA